MLILSGQRLGEVSGMRWSELDFPGHLWKIPKERCKNGIAHDVPLSRQAIAILGKLPRISGEQDFVFTTNGKTAVSGFSQAKRRLDAAVRNIPPWVLHDLRRTCASGCARLGMPVHVVEAVLNHKSGTIRGVAAVYNRYSYDAEKRACLEAWGRYVEALVTGETAGNVIELSGVRA
jgi:integrase